MPMYGNICAFQVGLVLGEPVFQTTVLPWDQISYWYMTSHLASCLPSKVKYLPGQMNVYAVAVEYEHLWKIRADVGVCEGFDIREFDNVIQVIFYKEFIYIYIYLI